MKNKATISKLALIVSFTGLGVLLGRFLGSGEFDWGTATVFIICLSLVLDELFKRKEKASG